MTSGTNLTEMPTQISQLKGLQQLSNFAVGKDSGLGVNGPKELHQLQEKLSISNLQNVMRERKADALEANLKEKELLQELVLEWGEQTADSQNERDVLENLQPHTNLKIIRIENYGDTVFPSWLGDHSFSNIVSLLLSNCKYCFSLPPLGQLCSLKDLTITEMNEIREVAPQFYGDVSLAKPFQSLERLSFESMSEWEEWSILGAGEFSRLQELSVWDCPELQNTSTHIPSLVNLKITNCPELEPFPPLGVFPKLRDLRINNFTKFETLSIPDGHGLQNLMSLEFVDISSCPNMKSFSQGGLPTPYLNYLLVKCCEKFKSLPERMQSLEKLEVCECPEIESFPEGGLPSACMNLMSGIARNS